MFAGGGALEDVEAICGGADLGIDVLDGLEALVDQSLVRQEQHGAEARAIMLETIREFALERLAASPDAEAVRSRHALRFLALAEEAVPHLLRVERRAWLARLEREHDNLRAAFDFCAGSGRILEALRLAGRDLALLAVPRPPARGGAAGQARARRSGVARPPGRPRGGARDRGRPRLLAR